MLNGRVMPGGPIVVVTHRGRHTGRTYRTPVEATVEDDERAEIIVLPAAGEAADWYRNAVAGGLVGVRLRGTSFSAVCRQLSEEERRLHLAYMSKAFRVMGLRFSEDRAALERFARAVEAEQAALSDNAPKHARHILRIGEMIGVPSNAQSILAMLPERTRAVFEPLYPKVRPGALRALWCRVLGRLLMPKAIGAPRRAVPVTQ